MYNMIWKIFFSLMLCILPGANATNSEIGAFFNETADLPCGFKNTQNISLEELVIFWQGAKDDVLYELYRGREKQIHVHPNYIDRTKYNQTAWILYLLNVQIADQGEYTCFVQYLGPKGLVIIHQLSFQLSVLAPFSKPEITRLDNKTAQIGDLLNFSCSSKQGYPKPREIYWIVEAENSTRYSGDIHLSQDDTNQLYNVTTALSLPITDSTIWINITCLLQTQGPVELLTSETLNIKRKPYEEPDSNFMIPGLIISVATAVVVLMIILGAPNWKKCPHFCGKREATGVNAEDTDHPKEKDEALEPVNHQMCEKREDR
ncbi:T-lymphocyte activation antigen CD86 [Phascolarctos cinereus]|uniref:T-lymphocyte activation antigen CD86 n=1 Tax=Phascolarctos cinereus TaxID=38626 RepID=A0A6P5K892_PHACI|nr:T-lymphocyte activation antigen CD86 [Phascolarctos cinereus]XP_020841586.1 T-lymphocyte activation antigen CD86 [Phascolarctos cinereus]XP_020841588.1 T-lymphocyte activation antigen CD86 [Phascolarctos cinereus]XP_020841589.1 T-lymphocyte activation antigen CD86 [Phascolarctos cinereus]XP_020841590.1 T-lymphocyte activation antigen CD86 [Phascolarctos cinereus]XP_020841591.1 T-lymphocyte activation antigen CD86 [Phascolarctos cinereus]